MFIQNNNTRIFDAPQRGDELQITGQCTHRMELNAAISPEVTEIINSQFFAQTVRGDRDLGLQAGDQITLQIDPQQIAVLNKRTGQSKFFNITSNLQTQAIQKANQVWQRHQNHCTEHSPPLLDWDDQTLRLQIEENEKRLEAATRSNLHLTDENNRLGKENGELRRTVEVTNEGAQQLTDEIEQLQQVASKAQQETEEIQRELLEVKEQLRQEQGFHDLDRKELELEKQGRLLDAQDHQRKKETLEQDLERVNQMFHRAAHSEEELRQKLEQQQRMTHVAQEGQRVAEQNSKLDQKAYERLQMRHEDLKHQNQETRLLNEQLGQRVHHLTTDVHERDLKIDELAKQLRKLKEEHEELRQLDNEAFQELEEQTLEIERLRKEYRGLLDTANRFADDSLEIQAERNQLLPEKKPVNRSESPPPLITSASASINDDGLGNLVVALEQVNHALDRPQQQPTGPINIPKKFQTAMQTNFELLQLGYIDESIEAPTTLSKYTRLQYTQGAGIVKKHDPTKHQGANYNAWRKGQFDQLHSFLEQLERGLVKLQGNFTPQNVTQLLLHEKYPFFVRELLAYENLLKKVENHPTSRQRMETEELMTTLRALRNLRTELTKLVTNVSKQAHYVG